MAASTSLPLALASLVGFFPLAFAQAARADGGKFAPPLATLSQRALELSSDVSPQGTAKSAAFFASMRGKAVANWEVWVAKSRCAGASCDVSFYGEDPYAPLVVSPPTPVLDALLGPGTGLSRYPYLTAIGVSAATGKSLRLGQRLRISATLVEVSHGTGLDVTLSGAQLEPLPDMPASVDDSAPPEDDMQITLHRGPCYGRCPIYDLTIDGDGSVTFHGERFVAAEGSGTHKAQISPTQRKALLTAFTQADFFALQDRYQRPVISDAPSVVLTIRRGVVRKTIHHSFGDLTAPVKLLLLEDQIDEIAGTRRWLPTR